MAIEHICDDENLDALALHLDNLAADYNSGNVKVRMPAHDALTKIESMGRTARDILSGAYRPSSAKSDKAAKDWQAALDRKKAERVDRGHVA